MQAGHVPRQDHHARGGKAGPAGIRELTPGGAVLVGRCRHANRGRADGLRDRLPGCELECFGRGPGGNAWSGPR